jgi:two-component system sensor histidine kinase YesM
MLRLMRNLALKNKIALLCVFLVFFSSVITTIFFYGYVGCLYQKNADVNSSDMMAQVCRFMDERLKDIIRRVSILKINTDFNDSLTQFLFSDDHYSHALALTRFSVSFAEIRSLEKFISSVYLYTAKGDFYDLSRIPQHGFNFKQSRLYQNFLRQPVAPLYWGSRGVDAMYIEKKIVIPLVIPFSVEGYSENIYFVINLDEQAILEYLASVYSETGNWILILDKKGRPVVRDDTLLIRRFMKDSRTLRTLTTQKYGNLQQKYGAESYIVSYRSMSAAPWVIVNIKSKKALLRKFNRIGIYIIILTIPSIILCLILTFFLSRSITRPLALLEHTIHKVTQRDLSVRFKYAYQDEVGQLGQSFNFMIDEIQQLINKLNSYILQLKAEKEKVKNEQLLKRRAELKALQAQINPHFLYNTLDSIHWMAEKIAATEISEMTLALGALFRTGVNRGREFIPIRDELENVSSYLTIQKMRYGDKFDYLIRFNSDLGDLMTIKLILQPLVENSIYHGLKAKVGSGRLEISGELAASGDRIVIRVWDDGVGINPAKLALLNKHLQQPMTEAEGAKEDEAEGYGVFNVNKRIKLYFGNDYGLKFWSEPGQGTEARILIPVLRKEDIHRYV